MMNEPEYDEGGSPDSGSDGEGGSGRDSRHKKCAACHKDAIYGPEGGRPLFCEAHKESEHVQLRDKRVCLATNCNTRASYGHAGENPRCCVAHKTRGMVLLIGKSCEVEGCTKRANYGYSGKDKRFCSTHKLAGMVDLSHERRQCAFPGCATRRRYGPSRQGATHCEAHREHVPGELVLDFGALCTWEAPHGVVTKTAGGRRKRACGRQAVYGLPGTVDMTHCDVHKLPGHVPLRSWHKKGGPGAPLDDLDGGPVVPAKRQRVTSLGQATI